MATNPSIANAAARAGLDAILAKLNAGSGPGVLKVYTGTPPGAPTDAATGTLLATLTLSDPAFPASADDTGNHRAKATASAISSATAGATGTAGYVRGEDSDGNGVIQGTAGTTDADAIFDSVDIESGDTVSCSSWIVYLPDGTD